MKSKSVFASAVNCCDFGCSCQFLYYMSKGFMARNHCDLFADLGRTVMSWQLDV